MTPAAPVAALEVGRDHHGNPISLEVRGRASYLAAQPVAAALVAQLQRAVFSEWPRAWDATAAVDVPAYAGNRRLSLAEPGTRVDHFVRRLARAHTALALALEQPASGLLPLSRQAAWVPALNSRHHAPLVRARAVLEPLALSPRFSGALCFGAEAAPEAVRLWFWAERLGVFPGGLQSWWALPGGGLMLSLCAHGVLHADAYGTAALAALDRWAPGCGWTVLQGACASAWQQGTAIAGRRLVV